MSIFTILNLKKILIIAVIFGCFYTLVPQKKQNAQIIAITQIAPHPSLDAIRKGATDTLLNHFDGNITIIYQNAQNQVGTANQIAKKFISQRPQAIIPITTLSAQTIKNAANNHKSNTPIVFAGVTYPEKAGLFDNPKLNIHGVSDALDPKLQIDLLKRIYKKKFQNLRIGTIYSIGEINAVTQVEALKSELKNEGLNLKSVGLHTTSEIAQTAQSLCPHVDVIYIMNDNGVVSGLHQLLNIAQKHGVAVFTSDPDSVALGALAAVAYGQYEIGVLAAHIAISVLEDQSPSKNTNPPQHQTPKNANIYINGRTAKNLNISIDADLLHRSKIYPETP